MPSKWWPEAIEGRGAYSTVAQTEGANGEGSSFVQRTLDGEHVENPPIEQDLEQPTAKDLATLPRVSDKLPRGAFLVAIVELCERFSYYGLSGPFQNYMANRYKDPNGLPGAIGLKQSGATGLSNLFQLWCYITPTLGAIVADQFLGKYRTIKYFSVFYMLGIVVLFLTSLPYSIEHGGAFPGLLVAMFIIGVGTGGIKSNVSPLIAEQVPATKPFIRRLKNGKRVIVDPEMTVQRIYMIFYMCINLGSISAIATTMLEQRVGFWSAYLLPLFMFIVGFYILVSGKDRYIIKPPQGGVITNCFKAMWIASRNQFSLDAARPSSQRGTKSYRITWDDKFVDELRTALVACKVFLFFPIYWLTFSQMMNNFISQAGQMELHGLPNDILPNIDPITIVLLIPVLDRIIYPFIRTRLHLAFTPITRIFLGFLIAALAMAYAAILQFRIYAAPPCYSNPLHCDAGKVGTDKYKSNEVHVAWQAPAYILVAVSEILASITGLELAYAKAPESMKSFIMSLFLLTSAAGSGLGMLIAPSAKDPYLVWLYGALAVAAGATGCVFHWMFKGLEDDRNVVTSGSHMESAVDEDIELVQRDSIDSWEADQGRS